jgi:hypothetical protein
MKHYLSSLCIYFVFFISSVKLSFAQLEKKQFVFELSGGYQQGFPLVDSDVLINTPNKHLFEPGNNQQRKYAVSSSLGYFITNRWLIRAGLDFSKSTLLNRFIAIESKADRSQVKTSGERQYQSSNPVYFGEVNYLLPLGRRFFFSPSLRIDWGKEKGQLSELVNYQTIVGNETIDSGGTYFFTEWQGQNYAITLSPNLFYSVNSWFGIRLTGGGLNLQKSNKGSETYLTRYFGFNVNPSVWTLGVLVNTNFKRASQ